MLMMKSKPPILPLTNLPPKYPISNSNSNSYLGSSSSSSSTMFYQRANNYELPTTHLLVSPIEEDEYDYKNKNSISIDKKPLLSRAFSFTGKPTSTTYNQHQQQRRRRSASDDNLASISNGVGVDEEGSSSVGATVENAAAETFFITRLAFKLLSYLGVGYRWIMRFFALGCYAILLMPGFVQVGYKYFFSSRILRGIVYGDQPRNSLDLFLPKNNDGLKPVVAFVTGGAWIIGYKAWGSLLGQQLSDRDIMVACIDYRNFPQGTMRDMIEDASRGISFVCKHIEEYGGDPSRIYLMGQSAGAHISACTLIEQAIKEAGGEGESVSWSVSQIKAYFGLSGGYNLLNLVDHFHKRGLYRSIFSSIMGGEQSLRHYSPEIVAQDPNLRSAVSLLPPITLFHGTADYSIPSEASENFARTLQDLGVEAQAILYEGKTHTDVFLQDPMRGGDDPMFDDLVAIIHAGDDEALARDEMAPPRKRLVPEFMLKLAHTVSPF